MCLLGSQTGRPNREVSSEEPDTAGLQEKAPAAAPTEEGDGKSRVRGGPWKLFHLNQIAQIVYFVN